MPNIEPGIPTSLDRLKRWAADCPLDITFNSHALM